MSAIKDLSQALQEIAPINEDAKAIVAQANKMAPIAREKVARSRAAIEKFAQEVGELSGFLADFNDLPDVKTEVKTGS